MKDAEPAKKTDEVPSWVPTELPRERLWTYALLWNFENWLRTMVYVELRACYGNAWESRLMKGSAEKAHNHDKNLSHMPTREHLPTSYMQIGNLLNTVDTEWRLFEPYFPPQDLWNAKMQEIRQIRHRVAHFRVGHEDDQRRVKQVLRDIDQGFWRFCTSYNEERSVLPASNDSVTGQFVHLDPFPWSKGRDGMWARVGIADPRLRIAVRIEVTQREWASDAPDDEIAGKEGFLYDVLFLARGQHAFDYSNFLTSTKRIHSSICHICLGDGSDRVRITIPSILGGDRVVDMVNTLVTGAENSMRPTIRRTQSAESIAEQEPEYVLSPSNPLTFLCPDMPCSFFSVE